MIIGAGAQMNVSGDLSDGRAGGGQALETVPKSFPSDCLVANNTTWTPASKLPTYRRANTVMFKHIPQQRTYQPVVLLDHPTLSLSPSTSIPKMRVQNRCAIPDWTVRAPPSN